VEQHTLAGFSRSVAKRRHLGSKVVKGTKGNERVEEITETRREKGGKDGVSL